MIGASARPTRAEPGKYPFLGVRICGVVAGDPDDDRRFERVEAAFRHLCGQIRTEAGGADRPVGDHANGRS